MKKEDCPFCNVDLEVISESDHCFTIYDRYPVNRGHVLVISRPVSDYFDLGAEELAGLWEMVAEMCTFLQNKFKLQGFNVGRAADKTISCLYNHIIS